MSNGQEKELKELPEVNLKTLIETCTEGLNVVDGDHDFFNMFVVMTGFKKEALKLLNEPTNLVTNRLFLKLIVDTYKNMIIAVSRAGIAKDDRRVQLTKATIIQVKNALVKKREQLIEQRDATRDTAPPSEPNEQTKEKSTPRPPASWFGRFGRWGKGEEQPSGERIRQLLSRMQELNA